MTSSGCQTIMVPPSRRNDFSHEHVSAAVLSRIEAATRQRFSGRRPPGGVLVVAIGEIPKQIVAATIDERLQHDRILHHRHHRRETDYLSATSASSAGDNTTSPGRRRSHGGRSRGRSRAPSCDFRYAKAPRCTRRGTFTPSTMMHLKCTRGQSIRSIAVQSAG